MTQVNTYTIKCISFYTAYSPRTGDIRLVGGANSHDGRVEISVNGTWGTVCQDHFHHIDATVVCRQLGLEISGA